MNELSDTFSLKWKYAKARVICSEFISEKYHLRVGNFCQRDIIGQQSGRHLSIADLIAESCRSEFGECLHWKSSREFNIAVFSNSVEDESADVEVAPVVQEEEKPKSETGKVIARERDAAIKRKTLALDERMNDFKEMLRERGVRKTICYFVLKFDKFSREPCSRTVGQLDQGGGGGYALVGYFTINC